MKSQSTGPRKRGASNECTHQAKALAVCMRTAFTALAVATSTHAHALGQSRALHWAWRLYGGSSGDFASAEAVIDAWNGNQEVQYNKAAATNCGTAVKTIYELVNTPAGPGAIVNGQPTYLETDKGTITTFNAACYYNGALLHPASGPYSSLGAGGIAATANLACPIGWSAQTVTVGTVVAPNGTVMPSYQTWCTRDVPDPPLLCKGGKVLGDPIDPLAGAQIESAVDFASPDGLLRVARSYSSSAGGWNWEDQPFLIDFTGRGSSTAPFGDTTASLSLIPPGIYPNGAPPAVDTPVSFPLLPTHPDQPPSEVWVMEGDGTPLVFTDNGASFVTSDLEKPTLGVSGSGASLRWALRTGNWLSLFDASGRITQKARPDGKGLLYSYQPGAVTVTAYPGGRQLVYAQSNQGGPYDQVTLPGGGVIHYQINAFGEVEGVRFPGSTSLTYLYNEPSNTGTIQSTPSLLTGLIDENEARTATFRYNGLNAISTEQAGGVNKFSFTSSGGSSGGRRL